MKRVLRTNNEILIFLMNFFLLETVGRLLVLGLIHALRFFGVIQPYYLHYGHRVSKLVLFTLMLLTAVGISFWRILRKKKRHE